MPRGRLIGVCGIDGAGKSTQVRMLTEHLREGDPAAMSTKTELSATYSIFSLADRLLGDPFGYHPAIPATLREFTVCCDVLRFSETRLKPLLARGGTVVWDRSPLCYEVYARTYGADMEWPLRLLAGVEQPDLIVLLDVDAEHAAARLRARPEKPQQSNETAEFLARVRAAYLDLAQARDDVVVVDGGRPAGDVHDDVVAAVRGRLGDWAWRPSARQASG